MYLLDNLTGGLIANPYGLFTNISSPVKAILEANLPGLEGLSELGEFISPVAMALDLVIVEFLALFLGFFISAVSTGIWTKKGNLSIFSLILKPFALMFMIAILISIPFVYHGLANISYGALSMAAGATEFMAAFGFTGAGTGSQSQNLDLNDPNVIANLTEASERAAKWFEESTRAFKQVQSNFLVNLMIDAFFAEGSANQFQGGIDMQRVTDILDIAEVLSLISGELPVLFAGFQNLVSGFDLTFSVLGETDLGGGFGSSTNSPQAVYDPDFSVGLDKIGYAVENFTSAQSGVVDAITAAKGIISEVISESEAEGLSTITDIIDEVDIGYSIILSIALGGIDFLNATYKTTLAVEDIGNSDFPGANIWLNDAAGDLLLANSTLQGIDSSELDNNSRLPFYGTVEIIKDMTSLLSWFALAAANGTQCYTAMEDVLTTLQSLDFTGTDVLITDWNAFAASVNSANVVFHAAKNNIGNATEDSLEYVAKPYGQIIDDSMKPMLIDFSAMMTSFSENITEMGHLMNGLTGTVLSIQSFTEGFAAFNSSYDAAILSAGGNATQFFLDITGNPDFSRAETLFEMTKDNASYAYVEIDAATSIDATVKTNWQYSLWANHPLDPDVNATPPYIAGLAEGMLTTIGAFIAAGALASDPTFLDLIQTYFDYMESVDLEEIFGGG
jgi:hypothetical protein